jgi:hypothetical protein
MCTTGIGISITANRFPNVKCALCHTAGQAKAAHRHCNANILALGAKSTSAKDTEGIIAKLTAFLPSAPAISPETERLQALMLKDTVKLIEDADTESRINVALGTSWIAAYDRSEIERYNDLNRLITAVGSMFGRHKINFIAQRHDESDADFAGRVAALEGGRTIIMAGLDTIAGDDSPFAGFRDREGVFLAGVDAKETGLDRNCYIQIVEMLKMALQIGLKDIIGQDSRSDSISAERYGRFTNVFRFLPRPRRFDESDYEKLRLIYEAQLFA